MNVFGRVAKGVFGKGASALDDEQDDSEVESLLHQISDSRHAGDRRDAMSQLSHLLQDNPRAQLAMGAMGLPVLLAVLQEDRDDLELLKEALEHSPPSALINADLFCRAPDNVLLLLGLLRPEPEGVDDFYARYGALQAMAALLAACPDKLQACVLSSPLGVVALSDLLASPMEVLRNEALLLLVGLCSGCPQIANIAAFEGAFERLLGICGSEGGPGGGNVVVQDAAELMNNLLRDNLANQRLFREMGHIQQLPQLLHFTPSPPAPASAAASAAAGMLGSAGQLGAAAGAAAVAAGSAVGAAVAAAGGAGAAAWPQQVAANYLCLMETAGLLLSAPCSANEEQRAQEDANRRANQQQLGQLGLLPLLAKLGADAGGAPSAAVRAQALFCLGDLVHGHAQLQEQLAGVLVQPPPLQARQQQQQQQPRLGGFLPPPGPPPAGARGPQGVQQHPLPLLQVALQLILRGSDARERAGAAHLMQAFCHANSLGQTAVLSTLAVSAEPRTFGEELLAALLCQPPPAAAAAAPPPAVAAAVAAFAPPGFTPQGLPNPAGVGSPRSTAPAPAAPDPLDLQLQTGRAARVLGWLLHQNPGGQHRLLALQLSEAPGDMLLPRCVRLLSECMRRAEGAAQAKQACCSVLVMLVEWCAGCEPAVAALLAAPSHLPLLVDVVGARVPGGDANTSGLAAVLLGVCLMFAPESPISQQQQQQAAANGSLPPPPQFAAAAPGSGLTFSQLLDVLLSRSKPQQLAAAEAAAEGSAAAGSGPRSHGAANGVLGGGSGDAESRVAAQLRASRAEMEAGAMRQQLAAMQERWSGMEAAAAAAREEAEAAAAAAAKAEADLSALSSAYNGLEQHAFEMEEQLRRLQDQQQQQQQQGSAGAAAGLSEADVAARVQAAVEEDRRQRLHVESSPGAAGTAGAGGAEAAIAAAAAAAEARAAAEAAAEEEMEDLLACLGEEQAKVEVLSSRLEELGEDVDKLLEAVAAAAADDEQDDEEGGVHQEDGELL
ncbi:hypothetical protein OEZ85_002492 [Tetradesmus obliquus]|uniref:Vesicle tethering protein Uso1/P115-like head domain-containing protein n=1 Tax=Tetradesmus obliquus TaxID=3088 RepID=A0ABY8U082_TETOB|nr:hypothetical protein OEZ85_002492 [Tetradesmus obliquus]